MPEKPRTELDVDAAGGVAEHIGAQASQDALEDDDHDQADDQHVERGDAAVHEHLVHHDLEEQRADECEELQDEADAEDFEEQAAVFDEAGDEPAEVESGERAGGAGATGDEDEAAGPVGGEGVERFDDGSGNAGRTVCSAIGVLQKNALRIATREDDEALGTSIVSHESQRRQRQQRQSFDVAFAAPRAQAQQRCGAQNGVGVDDVARSDTQLVRERFRVGCDLMKTCDGAQRAQRTMTLRACDSTAHPLP